MTGSIEQKGGSPGGMGEPSAPPSAGGNPSTKWFVVIIVLLVVIAGLAVVIVTQPKGTTTTITPTTGPTAGTTASATISTATANIGAQVNYTVTANGPFQQMTINWGDGYVQTVPYSGSNTVAVSHSYRFPGTYAVYYVVNFNATSSTNNANALNPVTIGYPNQQVKTAVEQFVAYASYELDIALSSAPTLTNPFYAFAPGSDAVFNVSAAIPGGNFEYGVVSQSVLVYQGAQVVQNINIPYAGNVSDGAQSVNILNTASAYYTIAVATYTAPFNGTGMPISSPTNYTFTYYDVPSFTNVSLASSSAASGQLIRYELETGGFKTLDPAIEYDTVSNEIVMNTYLSLFGYNQSGSSPSNAFIPILAKNLPTQANGEVNSNTYYYNITAQNGGTQMVKVLPNENYTIYINNNSKWQDGTPVTAYDVYYSIIRNLLFVAGSPGTPGWIQAQFLLPGNFYASNTFYNITTNMTYNNATNSLTLHLQSPVAPGLFYETFGQSAGANWASASWLIAHGSGIHPWNAAGFAAYQQEGNQGSYNTYVQYNVFADGPYMVSYSVPGQQIVLVANPNFVAPNPYFPAPTIKTIFIKWIGQSSTSYLNLKAGSAQFASIPTSQWNLVEQLQAQHTVDYFGFPTLSIFWFNFNALVNLTMLSAVDKAANLPAVLFDSLAARQAFAYAFQYDQFINQQIGNAVYNVTFASKYAGMLPAGMLYEQSISALNASGVTNGVPYFNLAHARSIWAGFVNSSMGAAMGITWNAAKGVDEYNGAVLNVPIFIFSADPVSLAGATSWVSYLQQVIPGFQSTVLPTSFPTLIGNMVQGQNPMPVYELGWAPDYPYPTDYLGPMALPVNSSTYPGPNDMTPYWFDGNASNPLMGQPQMVSQAHNLTSMVNNYFNGTEASNATYIEQQFHSMNQMLINMTFYVYAWQAYGFWVYNSTVDKASLQAWQVSTLTGMSGDLLYNYVKYV